MSGPFEQFHRNGCAEERVRALVASVRMPMVSDSGSATNGCSEWSGHQARCNASLNLHAGMLRGSVHNKSAGTATRTEKVLELPAQARATAGHASRTCLP